VAIRSIPPSRTVSRAIKHQRFVGNGYFDDVMNTVLRGLSASGAATESGEQD
jgi:isocitrate lyase